FPKNCLKNSSPGNENFGARPFCGSGEFPRTQATTAPIPIYEPLQGSDAYGVTAPMRECSANIYRMVRCRPFCRMIAFHSVTRMGSDAYGRNNTDGQLRSAGAPWGRRYGCGLTRL